MILKKIFRDPFFLICFFAGFLGIFPIFFLRPENDISLSHLYSLFLFILFYPTIEEGFFRGIIQGLLLKIKMFKNTFGFISIANLITTIFFVSAHYYFHNLGWSLLVFIPSILYGITRERFNHLFPPIILHIWYNTIYLTCVLLYE